MHGGWCNSPPVADESILIQGALLPPNRLNEMSERFNVSGCLRSANRNDLRLVTASSLHEGGEFMEGG